VKLIDLSHVFDQNLPVYPGDPLPEIRQIASLEKEGYCDYLVKTGMHVGTHLDAPLHMISNGQRISDIPLDRLCGRGKLIDARNRREISADLLMNQAIEADDILLVLTGHGERFRESDYYTSFPLFSESFAKEAVRLRVKLVGMDSPSPDKSPFLIHKILLGGGVLILENITNLSALLGQKKIEIFVIPPKFYTEAAPARVMANIE
jgi:kynurenine formamidase